MRRTELMTLAPKKFQADGIGDGLGQGVFFRSTAADTVDEDIGESSEEQAELVGFVGMIHAIGNRSSWQSLMRFSMSPRGQ